MEKEHFSKDTLSPDIRIREEEEREKEEEKGNEIISILISSTNFIKKSSSRSS
jgi:hypothetical protein